jgi:hypothetical protein
MAITDRHVQDIGKCLNLTTIGRARNENKDEEYADRRVRYGEGDRNEMLFLWSSGSRSRSIINHDVNYAAS